MTTQPALSGALSSTVMQASGGPSAPEKAG